MKNGNGLAQSHMVTISNSAGMAVAQVTIPSGSGTRPTASAMCLSGPCLVAGDSTPINLVGAFGNDSASSSALAIDALGVAYFYGK